MRTVSVASGGNTTEPVWCHYMLCCVFGSMLYLVSTLLKVHASLQSVCALCAGMSTQVCRVCSRGQLLLICPVDTSSGFLRKDLGSMRIDKHRKSRRHCDTHSIAVRLFPAMLHILHAEHCNCPSARARSQKRGE